MRFSAHVYPTGSMTVLILVVMEYTQWEKVLAQEYPINSVLILVVMEYTQWDLAILVYLFAFLKVLILVVMEYTQWGKQKLKSLSSGVLILVVMEYTQWDLR